MTKTFYESRNRIRTHYIKNDYGTFIVFDYFIRNRKIYFISTYYSPTKPTFKLNLEKVPLIEFSLKEQEPVRYFSGAIDDSQKEFSLYINGNVHVIQPVIVKELAVKHKLVVATLFKNETPSMIRRFLDYYRRQGVDHFYLYYNGATLPLGLHESQSLPVSSDITYRTWDFPYLLSADDGYLHCAQAVFLTTFRLRHFDDCEWAMLIDLDEFIWSLDEGILLIDYLNTVVDSEVNVVKLQNYWSKVPDVGGVMSFSGVGLGWIHRTKCIYRRSYRGYFGIHAPKSNNDTVIMECHDLYLLHLTTLHPERNLLIQPPILNTGISLLGIERESVNATA